MPYDIRDRNNIGEISVNHPNHIVVTADLSATGWKEEGLHKVFDVTGHVYMKLWARCTESATGTVSYFQIGTNQSAYAFSEAPFNNVNTGFVAYLDYNNTNTWSQDLITGDPEDHTVAKVVFVNGGNIVYGLSGGDTTNGTVEFHCIWQPLTAGATVTAGSGGSL